MMKLERIVLTTIWTLLGCVLVPKSKAAFVSVQQPHYRDGLATFPKVVRRNGRDYLLWSVCWKVLLSIGNGILVFFWFPLFAACILAMEGLLDGYGSIVNNSIVWRWQSTSLWFVGTTDFATRAISSSSYGPDTTGALLLVGLDSILVYTTTTCHTTTCRESTARVTRRTTPFDMGNASGSCRSSILFLHEQLRHGHPSTTACGDDDARRGATIRKQ